MIPRSPRQALPGIAAAVLVGVSPGAAPELQQEPALSLFHDERPAMGSSFEVFVYSPDRTRATALFDAAFAEIERVESNLSTYRATSELTRINRSAGTRPVTTDPETFDLLRRSIDYSRRTDGAFDVSVGRLMSAWGFFRGNGKYPSDRELADARRRTGWSGVELDATARTVSFRHPELALDLGAVGKGYALDRVAEKLRRLGVRRALLGAAQSTYVAIGAPVGEQGWPIDVPDPLDRAKVISRVALRDASLSTSGSYEKFFELDGKTYAHIIDPRTGRPAEDMLQATVVAATGERSDVAATAAFVGGPARAAEYLAGLDAAGALLVTGSAAAPRVLRIDWPGTDELGTDEPGKDEPWTVRPRTGSPVVEEERKP